MERKYEYAFLLFVTLSQDLECFALHFHKTLRRYGVVCRSRWTCGLRRRRAAARLLGSRV